MTKDDKDLREKLLAIVKRAADSELSLREKFGVKDKFSFVRDKLKTLSDSANESLADVIDQVQVAKEALADDETYVFVHLVNTQGVNFQTWQKMVNPAVFHEYSVNRPVYLAKEDVVSLIRSKDNKQLHGYLTFRIKKSEILPSELPKKDALDHELAKIKEGVLKYDQCVGFSHNGHEYIVGEEGRLKLKESH